MAADRQAQLEGYADAAAWAWELFSVIMVGVTADRAAALGIAFELGLAVGRHAVIDAGADQQSHGNDGERGNDRHTAVTAAKKKIPSDRMEQPG